SVEGVDQFLCPGPSVGEAERGASSAAGDDGGGVGEAVAEPFGFGSGEFAVEAEELGPGHEVLGGEDDGEPGCVDGEALRWQVAQAGVFGVADALFGAAPASVERFEVGDVGGGEVGDEDLEAVPVDVGEGELGAGVGVLPADDGPGPSRPARQVQQVGD